MATVLVTGGSGFLGINLIRYLLAKGDQVVSLDFAPFEYPEKNKINAILEDIRHPEAVDAAMKWVDYVVHCAAALPLYLRKKSTPPMLTVPALLLSRRSSMG